MLRDALFDLATSALLGLLAYLARRLVRWAESDTEAQPQEDRDVEA